MEKREMEKRGEDQDFCGIVLDRIFQPLLIFIFGLACGYYWCWNAFGQRIGG